MTRSTGQRKTHIKNLRPRHPEVKSLWDWFPPNRGFYADFRTWLNRSGYSYSALSIYSVAVRLALGLLDKPYWQIDPQADLEQVRQFIIARYPSGGTRTSYNTGLLKLADYLRLRCHTPRPERRLNWDYYVGPLPGWLADDVRAYHAHCQRRWPPERRYKLSVDCVSELTRPLRWLVAHFTLNSLADLTPEAWEAYLDARLLDGLKPISLNDELRRLQGWLHFLVDAGRPVCRRLLRIAPLEEGPRLPRDAPVEQLRCLLQVVEMLAHSSHAGLRRMGLMDRAWVLLMLHSGLRTGEVRRLRLSDIDWANRRVRIEQSKGLKDRLVCLSAATIDALKAYLEVRGPAEALPEQAFIYRHAMVSQSYCGERLKTLGKSGGFRITPHQLRHSCATLLLNAGAPVLTVQTILGHKHIATTLGYARLYDGTVAADYYRAMAQIERQMALPEDAYTEPPSSGQLLALVDALRSGTLNESQQETVRVLRAGITALAEQAAGTVDTDRQVK